MEKQWPVDDRGHFAPSSVQPLTTTQSSTIDGDDNDDDDDSDDHDDNDDELLMTIALPFSC